jgi:hypothetical protein
VPSDDLRPPYSKAADNRRPYGAHRFDVYSLKARRRLTLFGRRALEYWIRQEADPSVTQLCERPLVIPDTVPHRTVDFWVAGSGFSRFVLLQRPAEARSSRLSRDLTAFGLWAADAGCSVEVVPEEPAWAANSRALANWVEILQHLAAYESVVDPPLLNRVEQLLSTRRPLGSLVAEIPEVEQDTVRAAVYRLVYRGTHTIPALDRELLNDGLIVVAR